MIRHFHQSQSRLHERCHGGQAPRGATPVRESAAPLFIPELTDLRAKTNAERLADYRAKYDALTNKEMAA